MPDRARARALAKESIRNGDPTGWFERLYKEAEEGKSEVPWADLRPNPHLVDFWKSNPKPTAGKSALVIGSGFGDDAEQLAGWGFQTIAFDISETAIRTSHKRFPETKVKYVAADLFAPPPTWAGGFDFVLETYTLQVLPEKVRARAFDEIASFVGPRGQLLVVARGREETDPPGEMPWPLTRREFKAFVHAGLQVQSFEDFVDTEEPAVRRFRVSYRRD